jgi:hypothetical protein
MRMLVHAGSVFFMTLRGNGHEPSFDQSFFRELYGARLLGYSAIR